MSKKFGIAALACVSMLGLRAMAADAQIPSYSIQTQTFTFTGTCSGTNSAVGTPAIVLTDATGALAKSATITGADVLFYQPPTGLQYAYLNISGDNSTDLVFVGPGQTHVTTFFGSSNTNSTTSGNGVYLPFGGGLNLSVSCSSGPWQAFGTIWYHVP